ncbi:MAG: putative glycoside hydrolase [Candidatus Aminicenantaceae bacterium]
MSAMLTRFTRTHTQTDTRTYDRYWMAAILGLLLVLLSCPPTTAEASTAAVSSDGVSTEAVSTDTIMGEQKGVYFPANCLSGRSFEALVHYLQAAGLDLAVLHAKDPLGRLFWRSENPTAQRMGAVSARAPIETAVNSLKQKGIWTAAKVDVFQDSLLVQHFPEMGVMDSETGELWADHKGLHWANPHDRRVWEYTVDLCLELIQLGVDEIQFDYVRFPSDGNMSTLDYPVVLEDTSPAECIGRFLAYASSRIKPTGAVLSVDVFGMTAWKTDDFGVGQVLEQIAPHVDVICPMLYPSHFPNNFLNLENPGQYPHRIMSSSLEEMKKRTDKKIRPWIQGFWYTPEEIDAQFRAVSEAGIQAWTVWHPRGKYAETFQALEARAGTRFAQPVIYPSLEDLRDRDNLVWVGQTQVINYTCYGEGYSILSLDESIHGGKYEYATIMGVVSTLDEAISDRILTLRGITFSTWANRYAKDKSIVELIIGDLEVDPCRMRAEPIYIDWEGGAIFSRSVPPEILALYESQGQEVRSSSAQDIQRRSERRGIR